MGQALLMMMYQKLFREYNHIASQILMTKHTLVREESYFNAKNTFHQLLAMDVIPIVNENDTILQAKLKSVITILCQRWLLLCVMQIY